MTLEELEKRARIAVGRGGDATGELLHNLIAFLQTKVLMEPSDAIKFAVASRRELPRVSWTTDGITIGGGKDGLFISFRETPQFGGRLLRNWFGENWPTPTPAVNERELSMPREGRDALLVERDALAARVKALEGAAQASDTAQSKLQALRVAPVPMVLHCPECRARHIDEGEFATKLHHTHSCQSCGLTWRPAIVPTVGVQFLPGFKNESPTPASAEQEEACIHYNITGIDPDRGVRCLDCGKVITPLRNHPTAATGELKNSHMLCSSGCGDGRANQACLIHGIFAQVVCGCFYCADGKTERCEYKNHHCESCHEVGRCTLPECGTGARGAVKP